VGGHDDGGAGLERRLAPTVHETQGERGDARERPAGLAGEHGPDLVERRRPPVQGGVGDGHGITHREMAQAVGGRARGRRHRYAAVDDEVGVREAGEVDVTVR